MEGKATMARVRLEELDLIEAWSKENDDVRARFDFDPGGPAHVEDVELTATRPWRKGGSEAPVD